MAEMNDIETLDKFFELNKALRDGQESHNYSAWMRLRAALSAPKDEAIRCYILDNFRHRKGESLAEIRAASQGADPGQPAAGLDPKEYLLSAISCIHAGRGVKAISLIEKAIAALSAPKDEAIQ